jgi:hypothetical protein
MSKIEKNKFNIGHTPIGTVAEFSVITMKPVIATVTAIQTNGPNSFILTTDAPGNVTEFQSFNISWVSKIIKRGTGGTKITHDRYGREDDLQKEFEELYELGARKSKSQYANMYMRHLVVRVAEKYTNDTMWLDMDKLMDLVFSSGILTVKSIGEYNRYVLVNKQKLNKLIKRNINRCLANRRKAQLAEDKENQELYERDYAFDLRDMLDRDEEDDAEPVSQFNTEI